MKYTWLGHAGIRLEIGDQVLLIDPWENGCPTFPATNRAEMYRGATAILITHGHFDHTHDAVALSREFEIPVYGIVELMSYWAETEDIATMGFNKGGTVQIGSVAVTMVNAVHSSSFGREGAPIYAGAAAGFMIQADGRTVYVSGDTDVMSDMGLWADLHAPDVAILCAGGHFTMDMARAAYAAQNLLKVHTVIPVHYQTFPLLAQSTDALRAGAPGIKVIDPAPGETVEI